jgi:FkbM family methyltransferase
VKAQEELFDRVLFRPADLESAIVPISSWRKNWMLIYDVGAHKGEDTDYFLKKGFRVVAVEADPALARALRDRFAPAILSRQLTVVEAAVADEAGEIEFFHNEGNTVWGTIHQDWAERNEKLGAPSSRVQVRAVRFEDLLGEYGVPYYLKVDIEGADMLCVSALASIRDKPMFVSLESTKTSWADLLNEFDVLDSLGYKRFQVVNQAKVEEQSEPNPPREGSYSGHKFQFGSTGLFGNDLPGPWLTKVQALRKYAPIFLQYKFFGDNTRGERFMWRFPKKYQRIVLPVWYDTHAALAR